ncbi:hypothetical protein ATCC90586_011669 [Pythium insidiosum]|nr:hypothetical protein ATCC90586_011669 [Pythium insidiosum]
MDVDVVLAPIVVQLAEAVLLMALVLYVERRSQRLQRRSKKGTLSPEQEKDAVSSAVENENEDENEDVAEERRRLDDERLENSARDAAIVLRHVHHRYGDGRVALHDLSLSIPRGRGHTR